MEEKFSIEIVDIIVESEQRERLNLIALCKKLEHDDWMGVVLEGGDVDLETGIGIGDQHRNVAEFLVLPRVHNLELHGHSTPSIQELAFVLNADLPVLENHPRTRSHHLLYVVLVH